MVAGTFRRFLRYAFKRGSELFSTVGRRSAGAEVLATAGSHVAIRVLAFAIGVLTARSLGPNGKGAYVFIVVLLSTCAPIGLLGLDYSVRYFVASGRYLVNEIFPSVVCAAVVGTGLATALVLSLATTDQFANSIQDGSGYLLVVLGLSVGPEVAKEVVVSFLLGSGRFRERNLVMIIDRAMLVSLLTATVLVGDLTLKAALVARLLAVSAALVTGCWLLLSQLQGAPRAIHFRFLLEATAYGARSLLGSLAQRLNARLDVLALGAIAGGTALGYYSVAYSVAAVSVGFLPFVGPVLFQRAASRGSTASRGDLVALIHRLFFWLSLLACLGLLLIAKTLVPIVFGSEYDPAVPVLGLLLPGILMNGSARVLRRFLFGDGRPLTASSIHGLGLLVLFPAYFFLVPILDEVGAAIATSLGYSVMGLCAMLAFKRITANDGGRSPSLFRLQASDVGWALRQLRSGRN